MTLRVEEGVELKCDTLLGGQVWLILEFSTEKPIATYLSHILQNQFYQN